MQEEYCPTGCTAVLIEERGVGTITFTGKVGCKLEFAGSDPEPFQTWVAKHKHAIRMAEFVLVDTSPLTFMDGRAIGFLMMVRKHARCMCVRFSREQTGVYMARLLSLVGLGDRITIVFTSLGVPIH